jgi:energy-converting hydrogenase Eha subunit A
MKNSASAKIQTKPAVTSEQAKALEFLRRFLRKGTTIYTVLRHVSTSGTSRFIDLYVMKQNKPIRLTWSASVILEWTYSRPREALCVNGCGTDVGFHAVYTLADIILGNGYVTATKALGIYDWSSFQL